MDKDELSMNQAIDMGEFESADVHLKRLRQRQLKDSSALVQAAETALLIDENVIILSSN